MKYSPPRPPITLRDIVQGPEAPLLPSTHPLADLQAKAALLTGWPVLHGYGPDEASLAQAQKALESVLGPCPQIDIIEPWDPTDALDRWELRAVLPGLTQDRWHATTRAMTPHLSEPAILVPAAPPGTMEARDQQAVVSDEIVCGDLEALLWSATDEGGTTPPNLVEEPDDAEGAHLAAELSRAVSAVAPELATRELVAFVRDQHQGRRGLQVNVPFDVLEGLPGEEVLRLRQDLLAAVVGVVQRRASHEHALAPDVLWDLRWGLSFLVWRVQPPGACLPGDSPIGQGMCPPTDHLAPWIAGLDGRYGTLEIQIVPRHNADHYSVIEEGVRAAEGTQLVGSMPRWVPARDGMHVRPAFVPTWRCPVQHAPTMGDWLAHMQRHPAVLGVRVVPVEPAGLESADPFMDPCWLWMGDSYIVRLRDGVVQRDRLIATASREHEGRDRLAEGLLAGVLGRVPQAVHMEGRHLVRAMRDDSGRDGLELRLTDDLLDAPRQLGWLLQQLSALPLPDVTSVIELAMPTTGPLLRFWYRHHASEWHAPTWI